MAAAGRDDPEDVISEAEITGDASAKKTSKRSAFAELMAPKPKRKVPPPPADGAPASSRRGRHFQGRDALEGYLTHPERYVPPMAAASSSSSSSAQDRAGQVLYYDDDFVAICDKFPKAEVHCLLLPRDLKWAHQHPVALLSRTDDDEAVAFRARLCAAAEKLACAAAAELRRRFGGGSAADADRQAVLRGETEGDHLPPGRDWRREVRVGVHCRPSMHHLHVHVISRDLHSARLRHRKHYNSFATAFFVPLDAFPLAADDPRQPPAGRAWPRDEGNEEEAGATATTTTTTGGHVGYLRRDLCCWRCGRNFGNRFQELKRHLDTEFAAWKQE